MTNRTQDMILSMVLLTLAMVWIWLVTTTIRGGFGGGDIGPRAFPLAFGILLAALSVLLIVRVWVMNKADVKPVSELADPDAEATAPTKILPALMVLGEICLYGYLLQIIGFLLATPVIILVIMLVNLRIRSMRLLLGMSLGVSVGSWLLFEKLLGIYLANGSWMNLG